MSCKGIILVILMLAGCGADKKELPAEAAFKTKWMAAHWHEGLHMQMEIPAGKVTDINQLSLMIHVRNIKRNFYCRSSTISSIS